MIRVEQPAGLLVIRAEPAREIGHAQALFQETGPQRNLRGEPGLGMDQGLAGARAGRRRQGAARLHIAGQRRGQRIGRFGRRLGTRRALGQGFRHVPEGDEKAAIGLPKHARGIGDGTGAIHAGLASLEADIPAGQSKLCQHRVQQARSDFLATVLEGGEAAAEIKPAMTALAVRLETDRQAAGLSIPPDPSFELAAGHGPGRVRRL